MTFFFDQTITLVFSGLHYLIWNILPFLLLERKYSVKGTVLGVLGGLLLFYLASYLPLFSTVRIFSGLLIQVVVTLALYRGNWYGKLAIAALSIIPMTLAELVMMTITPAELLRGGIPLSQQMVLYFVHLFVFCTLEGTTAAAIRALRRRDRKESFPAEALLFALFPASQYFALIGWWKSDPPYVNVSSGLAALSVLLFIASDIGMIVAIRAISRSAALRTQNALLTVQMEAEKGYYAALAANYEDIRRMRHDIANHLYAIRALIADDRIEEAAAYTDELSAEKLAPIEIIAGCTDTAVSSFLSHKRKELKEKGIELRCVLALPEHPGVTTPELVCALGNLLDNAVEACEKLNGPTIILTVCMDRGYLRLEVSNPTEEKRKQKAERISGLSRGLGQKILLQLAESHDGYYEAGEEAGTYHARLFLKTDAGQA